MDFDEIKKQATAISRQYRKANKLTQQQLGDMAGVSIRSIQNIERGVSVYDETLQKVLDACGWEYEVELRRSLRKKT